MNRDELEAALQRAGVPGHEYEIEAVHELGQPRPPAYYFLARDPNEWVVGVSERGRRQMVLPFADEDAACRYLYARLTERSPGPTPLTREETQRLFRGAAETQRAAWENFERQRDQ